MKIVLIMFLLITSAHAVVKVNKGPAFIEFDGWNGFDQDGLVAAYVSWNAYHKPKNELTKFQIRSTEHLYKNRILKPLDLMENHLAFSYKDTSGIYVSWDFVEIQYGFCHGMTMVNRQFAYLATFRPELKLKPEYSYESNPEGWLKYYKSVVDKIMSGKPAEIRGFNNLREFSQSPIAPYLQRHVADQWGLNTARPSMLKNVYKRTFKKLDAKTVTNYRKKITHFLARNFYPKIVLGPNVYSLEDPHVVMITKLYPETNKDCLKFDILNLGNIRGAWKDTNTYCVGHYAWISEDEDLYYLDFAKNQQRGLNPRLSPSFAWQAP